MRTRRGSLAPHSYGTKPGDGPGEGRPQLLLRANEWRSLLRTYSFLKTTYKFYTQIDTRHPPTPFMGERLKMSALRRDGRPFDSTCLSWTDHSLTKLRILGYITLSTKGYTNIWCKGQFQNCRNAVKIIYNNSLNI